MADQVLLKIYELKGMLSSFNEIAFHHDKYNYPLMKNIQKTMNEIVSLVSDGEIVKEKVVYPTESFHKSRLGFSNGFHNKSHA